MTWFPCGGVGPGLVPFAAASRDKQQIQLTLR